MSDLSLEEQARCIHARLEAAVVVSRTLTDLLRKAYPKPDTELELALIMVASGLARNHTLPLDAEQFAELARMVFTMTEAGPDAPVPPIMRVVK